MGGARVLSRSVLDRKSLWRAGGARPLKLPLTGGTDWMDLHRCSEEGPDPDPELMEPIQPSVSVSPHGRFERLQEDPDYISHFTRAPAHKGQRRLHCFLLRYVSAGLSLFVLGLLFGWLIHTPARVEAPDPPSDSSDLLEELLLKISAEKIDALHKNNLMSVDDTLIRFSEIIYPQAKVTCSNGYGRTEM
ncbi:Inactive N-acetylated-alpha-linked acidic dipeptidase-like protein 2, partial [Takifugu flavidus]